MPDIIQPRRDGSCPYCANKTLTPSAAVYRPGYVPMKCSGCLQWSVRMERNGTQYPLQNPKDEKSSPTVTGHR